MGYLLSGILCCDKHVMFSSAQEKTETKELTDEMICRMEKCVCRKGRYFECVISKTNYYRPSMSLLIIIVLLFIVLVITFIIKNFPLSIHYLISQYQYHSLIVQCLSRTTHQSQYKFVTCYMCRVVLGHYCCILSARRRGQPVPPQNGLLRYHCEKCFESIRSRYKTMSVYYVLINYA